MTDLRRHIPRVALRWDDEIPARQWQSVDATLVFADISGFTALTERLARRGRIGAEELIETLNRVFGAMLDQASIRGGELLKFGGDALLFTFCGDDHTLRACRSAVDMRRALRDSAQITTSVGRLRLSMSVGIHSGPVDFFLVGSPTRELLILGPAATATAEAEHAAVAGEILITGSAAARLPPGSTHERPDGLHRLRWRFTLPPEGQGPPAPAVTQERLLSLFPNALGEYLGERVPDPEHKLATIGFARVSGTDNLLAVEGHDAVADALHRTISVVQGALIGEGVTLLSTDFDSDGAKLFMSSGVPFSSEDDEGRMLRAMRHVLDIGTPLPLQIGVNRGHVFAAEVGAAERAAYSAMGDTTNTAARIMAKAPPGVLFAHPMVVEQSRTLFSAVPAGPFAMKGKNVPVPVLDVGEELGTREVDTRAELPLIGREAELAALRAALEISLGGQGGVITVSAATGLGKSRLIAEAIRDLEATVVRVRAEPYGMTSPYRMLRDPVRAALGIERGDPLVMAEQALAGFARIDPDLLPMAPLVEDVINVPIPATEQAAAIEPQFRPARIGDVVVRLIEETVSGPFVLVVEEAHWSDAASIAVLDRIVSAARGRPWAVVVARRTDGAGFLPDTGTTVRLDPLPDDAMRRIVLAATASAPVRPHEVDEMLRRAGGNPLYVEELARLFREVGSLEDLPDSLHAALDAQIDALETVSRRVLRYASVLGRSFGTEVLEETLRAESLHLDDVTLSRLAHYLEGDGRTRLRFRSGMIRDAAYEGLSYRLRTKLHTTAGLAVEKLSFDLDADSDTLSLHFWRGGDDDRTWLYSRMAGDRAARAYANFEAAVLYERAIEASRRLPHATDDERRLLWERLGTVRDLAGMYPQSVTAFTRALGMTRGDAIESSSLLLQRSRTRQRTGAYSAALSDLTRAQGLLGDDSSVAARRQRVRIRSMRAGVRQEQERRAETIAEARAVLDQARELGEYEALEAALIVLDAALFQLGDTRVGAGTEEALRSALARGNLKRATMAQSNLGAYAFVTGRWSEAAEWFAKARETGQYIGDVVGSAFVGLNLGELLVSQGRLDEADEVLGDAVRVLGVAGALDDAAYGRMHLARSRLARGDLQEAESMALDVERELAALGQRTSAAEAMLVRAEAVTRLERPELALELIRLSAKMARGEGVALLPRVEQERARALLALGSVAAAREAVTAGLELARTHGMPYEEATLLRLSVDVARAEGDHLAAAGAAEAADEVLRRLGLAT